MKEFAICKYRNLAYKCDQRVAINTTQVEAGSINYFTLTLDVNGGIIREEYATLNVSEDGTKCIQYKYSGDNNRAVSSRAICALRLLHNMSGENFDNTIDIQTVLLSTDAINTQFCSNTTISMQNALHLWQNVVRDRWYLLQEFRPIIGLQQYEQLFNISRHEMQIDNAEQINCLLFMSFVNCYSHNICFNVQALNVDNPAQYRATVVQPSLSAQSIICMQYNVHFSKLDKNTSHNLFAYDAVANNTLKQTTQHIWRYSYIAQKTYRNATSAYIASSIVSLAFLCFGAAFTIARIPCVARAVYNVRDMYRHLRHNSSSPQDAEQQQENVQQECVHNTDDIQLNAIQVTSHDNVFSESVVL